MDKDCTLDYDEYFISVSQDTKNQLSDRAEAKAYKHFLASMTYDKRRKYLAQQRAKQKRNHE
jgi:hypothetical protein